MYVRIANVALLSSLTIGGAKPALAANDGGGSARIDSTTVAYVRMRRLCFQRHWRAGFRHNRGCSIAVSMSLEEL